MKNIIVMDLDGCCINSDARLPYLLEGDQGRYDASWEMDTPIDQGVATYFSFIKNKSFRPIFITSRGEYSRITTRETLDRIFGPWIREIPLLMRDNTFTEGRTLDVAETDIKPLLLVEAGFKLEDVFLCFDDRDACVSGWRSRGITCYQTNYGDF